jgi:hypothetical protein
VTRSLHFARDCYRSCKSRQQSVPSPSGQELAPPQQQPLDLGYQIAG